MNESAAQHLRTGRWGEAVAAKFLRRQGYRILGRRVRVGTRDEIDLLARSQDVLVFVEVKARGGENYGRPLAAVDAHKRQVLSRAAVRYLSKLKNPRILFRFDVVEVIGTVGDRHPEIRHIENAFPLAGRYLPPA